MYNTYPQHQNYGPQHNSVQGYGYAPMHQPMPMQQMPPPQQMPPQPPMGQWGQPPRQHP